MDRNSIIELQKIDCNCNDCRHMVRDMAAFENSVKLHRKWQLDYFTVIRSKLYEKANYWLNKGEQNKHDTLKKEADGMKFQFDKSVCLINFGNCNKLSKSVTFIPNTCQHETQKCFEHRRA